MVAATLFLLFLALEAPLNAFHGEAARAGYKFSGPGPVLMSSWRQRAQPGALVV
ncbi:MAG: hypothetical protein GKR94_32045 [Gammaproteobacteria bacterium]|nr:hypothetical protein [Gammaproteobacteria bacterium]